MKFCGQYDKDIIASIDPYNTCCKIACVTEDEKRLGLPIMLDGAALKYFNSHFWNLPVPLMTSVLNA